MCAPAPALRCLGCGRGRLRQADRLGVRDREILLAAQVAGGVSTNAFTSPIDPASQTQTAREPSWLGNMRWSVKLAGIVPAPVRPRPRIAQGR